MPEWEDEKEPEVPDWVLDWRAWALLALLALLCIIGFAFTDEEENHSWNGGTHSISTPM